MTYAASAQAGNPRVTGIQAEIKCSFTQPTFYLAGKSKNKQIFFDIGNFLGW